MFLQLEKAVSFDVVYKKVIGLDVTLTVWASSSGSVAGARPAILHFHPVSTLGL